MCWTGLGATAHGNAFRTGQRLLRSRCPHPSAVTPRAARRYARGPRCLAYSPDYSQGARSGRPRSPSSASLVLDDSLLSRQRPRSLISTTCARPETQLGPRAGSWRPNKAKAVFPCTMTSVWICRRRVRRQRHVERDGSNHAAKIARIGVGLLEGAAGTTPFMGAHGAAVRILAPCRS